MAKLLKHKMVGMATAKRELRKRVALTGGSGFTTEHNGYELGVIEVLVDIESLVSEIGERALKNKSGMSKLAKGAIILHVRSRRTERKPE